MKIVLETYTALFALENVLFHIKVSRIISHLDICILQKVYVCFVISRQFSVKRGEIIFWDILGKILPVNPI
jgi:hypothetical protein